MPKRAEGTPTWEAYTKELGQNLQRARVAADLSQEAVAYSSGLSRYTYQKLEWGIARPNHPANPTLRTLTRICQSLGVGLETVLPEQLPGAPGD